MDFTHTQLFQKIEILIMDKKIKTYEIFYPDFIFDMPILNSKNSFIIDVRL